MGYVDVFGALAEDFFADEAVGACEDDFHGWLDVCLLFGVM